MGGSETTPWHSYEPIERYNSLFPTLPQFVAQHTVGLEYGDKIGLPDKYSLRLYRDILAALVADKLSISLDYAKRRYTKESDQSHWLGLTDRIDKIYDEGRNCFSWYVSFERDHPKDADSLRHLSAQFFYRSIGSLDAAKRLADLGYLFEVASILRSALEQFAFCSRLSSSKEGEDIRSIRPLHSLNHFKVYVPAAGRLYGLMSKYTHFEYDHHTHFFAQGPNEVQTIQKGPVLRAYSTHLLFMTMACVGAYIRAAARTQFERVRGPLREIDSFILSINKYSNYVCSLLPLDEILANMDILFQDVIRPLELEEAPE